MVQKAGQHTDGTGVSDEIHVQLNDKTVQGKSTLPKITEKPKSASPKSAWEEYAIQLGLDANRAADLDKDDLIKWCG